MRGILKSIFFFFLVAFAYGQGDGLLVNIQQGAVQGSQGENFRVWKGIPFGQANRWENPQPASSFGSTPFQAMNFGPECPQAPKTGPHDENCLYINVWAPPLPTNGQNYPVMVFIYGGGFFSGSGSSTVYTGEFYANITNTVLVTFNYRLGALGWLANPDATAIKGNYGLLDQQLAFQWVQENIAAFNGTSNNVTIFGQSAGAMSVMYHLASPASQGLFHAAILESNPAGVLLRTPAQNVPWYNLFCEAVGCPNKTGTQDQMDCLFNRTVEQLISAESDDWSIVFPVGSHLQDLLPWIPLIDGVLIPDQPMVLFQQGKYNQVPTIMGNVANETASFLYGSESKLPTNLFEYEILLKAAFGDNSKAVQKLYPATTDKQVRQQVTILTNDLSFTCPTRYLASLLAPTVPTYRYIFDHSPLYDPENANYVDCWAEPKGDGLVCHTSELPFVFHTETLLQDPMDPQEIELSFQMIAYWSSFANSTFVQLPENIMKWPLYTSADDSLIFTTNGNYVANNWRASYCNFWNSLGYYTNFGNQ